MLRKLRRRFGISAPNVTVKTEIAWYWRWLGLVVAAALVHTLAELRLDYPKVSKEKLKDLSAAKAVLLKK